MKIMIADLQTGRIIEEGELLERTNGMVRVRCGDGWKVWFEQDQVRLP